MSKFEMVAAFVVGVLATARLARLVVFDDYPPTVWLRIKVDTWTHENSWSKLVHCAYCLAPWIGLLDFIAGWASGYHWVWWVFNIWLAGGYLAAMAVAYDGDDD